MKGKLSENIKRIFCSEIIRGVKLKFGIHAKESRLYISFFISVRLELWLLCQFIV